MSFPLGRTIGVMLALAIVTGAVVATRRPAQTADLVVWVFDESHARIYRGDGRGDGVSLAEQFARRSGRSVRVELLAQRALDVRLLSLFMAPPAPRDVPDLVEVEVGSVGRFLRPAVDEIGFLPLNDYLQRSGLMGRLVPQRLAAWSKDGVIFGVPHDVHPVTITYNKDLFDQAGVDVAAATTWPEFQQKCLSYQRYWHGQGQPRRRAIALPRSNPGPLLILLVQRHVRLVDEHHRPHLDDPKVAQTLAFYAQLVAGDERIAEEPSAGALWTRDLAGGDVAGAVTPDWQVADLRQYAPALGGKLRMMPLPRFEPADAPTSTWGGTMIGIPRTCPDPEAAWELLRFLYFSPEGLEARRRYSAILPADREQWQDPLWHQPDTFFGGQKVGELYVDLAGQIPQYPVSPYAALAGTHLSVVLARAVDYAEANGPAGLEAACQRWLNEAQDELRRRIEFAEQGR